MQSNAARNVAFGGSAASLSSQHNMLDAPPMLLEYAQTPHESCTYTLHT
ncbi:hypothetical protein SLEP1_g16258 [Rubroshorea leprosula]|uniref:Uncharacterized protein n=1 Tax=Rubroshorea leprosula TaxID=152421 RepID=A0AAV5J0W9_9ROSI|nr:hypothetical protein SLEP1_g16258 [Rubroshorea leprosula]